MRHGFVGGAAFCGAVLLAGAAFGQDNVVHVYNWSDYIGETTLEDFTAETGIRVVYDVYDSNDVLEAKLLAGNSGYDVVVPTNTPYFARQVAAGLFQPIDWSQVPNIEEVAPKFKEVLEPIDPGNEHGVVYQWGTNGFGYNADMIEERMPDAPVDSFDMIFDPEVVQTFADCGVSFLDAPSDIIPMALHYLGLDPNSQDVDDLARAEELMQGIRPHVRYFHSSQYINDLATGEICLAVGWSGDIYQAAFDAEDAGAGNEIRYVIPEEGTLLWFDVMAVPADAPHPENAFAFINFVLRPDVMAGITDYVAYGNPVPASHDMVDPEIISDPGIFPPAELQEELFVVGTVDARYDRERTRAWTRIVTGR